jgi:hypothetical protein
MIPELKILITGDFCPVNRIELLSIQRNHKSIFNDFLPLVQNSDIAVTNLEAPLYNGLSPISKTGPVLKVPVEIVNSLKFAGFNLVSLANNHIMDHGNKGLVSTINTCEKNGIDTVGAGPSLSGARKIFYKEVKGKKLAFISFAENEWSTADKNRPGANPLNVIDNYNDIKTAKNNSEYVFVIVHGGHEMYNLPSRRMQSTYRFFIEAGADAVIGHHAHCYSGYEIFKGKPVFYNLGNFVFDNPKYIDSIWNNGFAVEFTIRENLSFNIIPYKQCGSIAGVNLLNDSEKIKFDSSIENLNKIISDEDLLEIEFEKYFQSVKNLYIAYLEPYSNFILHGLHKRKLIPSFFRKKKKELYLNLIRCESHRDIFQKILSI